LSFCFDYCLISLCTEIFRVVVPVLILLN